MKCDLEPSVIQMETETFKQLVAEVRETVAIIDLPRKTMPSFGLVDLWNIRRSAISASSRLRR